MVDMGGGSEEALLAHLALVGSLGQVGMGLPRGAAFDMVKGDVVTHG